MNRIIKKLLLAALCFFLMTGCVHKEEKPEDDDISYVTEGDLVTNIKERGFMKVGCRADVQDLSYYDEESKTYVGLEIDLAWETVARIFGVSVKEAKAQNLVQFTEVTVATREKLLRNGTVDVVFATFSITKERAKRVAFSDRYYKDYLGILVPNVQLDENSLGPKNSIRSIANLDSKYVGVVENTTAKAHMLKYINDVNSLNIMPVFCEFESYEITIKALQKGVVDAVCGDISILKAYINSNTKLLGDRFARQNYGAAVRLGDEELLDYINKTIKKHKA